MNTPKIVEIVLDLNLEHKITDAAKSMNQDIVIYRDQLLKKKLVVQKSRTKLKKNLSDQNSEIIKSAVNLLIKANQTSKNEREKYLSATKLAKHTKLHKSTLSSKIVKVAEDMGWIVFKQTYDRTIHYKVEKF